MCWFKWELRLSPIRAFLGRSRDCCSSPDERIEFMCESPSSRQGFSDSWNVCEMKYCGLSKEKAAFSITPRLKKWQKALLYQCYVRRLLFFPPDILLTYGRLQKIFNWIPQGTITLQTSSQIPLVQIKQKILSKGITIVPPMSVKFKHLRSSNTVLVKKQEEMCQWDQRILIVLILFPSFTKVIWKTAVLRTQHWCYRARNKKWLELTL